MSKHIVHASVVCLPVQGFWRGVLLMGPSGAGKSDLTLSCLNAGFRLVSDDYALVYQSEGKLFATAPETIKNLMEIRGLGIVSQERRLQTRLYLGAFLQTGPIERMPEAQTTSVLGLNLATICLNPFETSAVFKLKQALQCVERHA